MSWRSALLAVTVLSASFAAAQEALPAANPSRPSITNAPEIGPAGTVEVSAGFSGAGAEHWSTPLLVKYAISPRLEARIGSGGFARLDDGRGYGDTTLGLQYAPAPGSESPLRLAFFGAVKLPTGKRSEGLGSGVWDAGAGVAVAGIRGAWRCDSNVTLTTLRNSDGGAVPLVGGATFMVTRKLSARVNGFADAAIFRGTRGSLATDREVVAGLAFFVTPQLAFDVAVQQPLNGAGSDPTLLFGVSSVLARFGGLR